MHDETLPDTATMPSAVHGQLDRQVRPLTATVWLAPTARRRYLTKRAAITAEARALIKKKHPTERAEYEQGRMIYSGWHWTSLPRADVLFRRVCRLVGKAP